MSTYRSQAPSWSALNSMTTPDWETLDRQCGKGIDFAAFGAVVLTNIYASTSGDVGKALSLIPLTRSLIAAALDDALPVTEAQVYRMADAHAGPRDDVDEFERWIAGFMAHEDSARKLIDATLNAALQH